MGYRAGPLGGNGLIAQRIILLQGFHLGKLYVLKFIMRNAPANVVHTLVFASAGSAVLSRQCQLVCITSAVQTCRHLLGGINSLALPWCYSLSGNISANSLHINLVWRYLFGYTSWAVLTQRDYLAATDLGLVGQSGKTSTVLLLRNIEGYLGGVFAGGLMRFAGPFALATLHGGFARWDSLASTYIFCYDVR